MVKAGFRMRPLRAAVLAACMCMPAMTHADDQGSAVTTQDVSVLGQGQTREVQTLTQAQLQQLAPGTNPLQALAVLPGVQYESSDPLGNYEWSAEFNIRGFNQNQLGFTLDDIPLGDMSYGNYNGLDIGRAIAPENLSVVSVAQGIGALGTASTSNLGGTVQFQSADPLDTAHFTAADTGGSANLNRVYMRWDSGTFGASNAAKAYFSYSNNATSKWKGWGDQTQEMFNAKLVYQLGGENKLSFYYDASTRDETDYADYSVNEVNVLGWGQDNYAPNWTRAVNAANGIYSGGVQNLQDPLDAFYYLGRGLRNDELAGATGQFKLADNLRVKAVVYGHMDKGEGDWYTPYVASSPTVPISVRTTEYGIHREGVNASFDWLLGMHDITGGVWIEHNVHDLARRYYAINGPQSTDYFLTNPFYTQFQQEFVTNTRQLYLQDTLSLMDDRLTLAYGIKSQHVSIDSVNQIGGLAAGNITTDGVLPQVSMNYQIDPHNEAYASLGKNMRAFQPGVAGPFSATQAAFDATASSLKPETSTTLDIGVRTHRPGLEASLDLYNVDFHDRLLIIPDCAGIVGCPNSLANVGNVNSRGLEAAVNWSPVAHWSLLNSLTYNDSRYLSNYYAGTTLVNTSGKTVVDAPKLMYAMRLGYEKQGFFANLTGKYTDKRYITYTNDSSVPAFVLFDFGTGYQFKHVGALQDVRAQLNVYNLFNKDYFSSVGTNGFVASDPTGSYYTLQQGAPRMAFISLSGRY